MSTVNGTIALLVSLSETLSSGVKSGSIAHKFDLSSLQTLRLSSGTGSGQADKIFSEKDAPIGTATTVARDFAGVLTNSFAATETFVKLKLLLIYNSGTVPITIKSTVANALPLFSGTTDSMNLAAGACFFYFDPGGIAVGAGTTDQITLGNVHASIAAAFTMIAVGTST